MDKFEPYARLTREHSSVRLATGMMIGVSIVFILYMLAPLFQPLFLAVFLFYISTPVIRTLIKKGLPSWMAQTLAVFSMIGLCSFFIWVFTHYMDGISEKIPLLQGKIRESVNPAVKEIPFVGASLSRFVRGLDISRLPDSLVHPVMDRFLGVLSGGTLAIFYFIFIIHEANVFPRRIRSVFGEEKAQRLLEVCSRINKGIGSYLYVKFLASMFSAVVSFAVLTAFGIDYALLWSSIMFLANFIPYLGSIVAVSLPITLGFIQLDSISSALAMGGLLVLLDVFIGNYWEPKYAGSKLDIHPIAVLFWLSFWGWLWGVVGLVLAVPLLVILKAVLDNLKSTSVVATLIKNDIDDFSKEKSQRYVKPPAKVILSVDLDVPIKKTSLLS